MDKNMFEEAGGLWFLLTAVLLIGYVMIFYLIPPSCLYQLLAYLVTAGLIILAPLRGAEKYMQQRIELREIEVQQEKSERQANNPISNLRSIKQLQDDELINDSEYIRWKEKILSDIGIENGDQDRGTSGG
jgi:hypothetical protein